MVLEDLGGGQPQLEPKCDRLFPSGRTEPPEIDLHKDRGVWGKNSANSRETWGTAGPGTALRYEFVQREEEGHL